MEAMLLDGDRDLLIDFAGFASRCSVVARVVLVVGERSQFALGLQRLLLIKMVHFQCSTAKQKNITSTHLPNKVNVFIVKTFFFEI